MHSVKIESLVSAISGRCLFLRIFNTKMKTILHNGIQFVLGQSAKENWAILAAAEKDFMWAHLDDYASAHVILETDAPTIADLEFARQLILQQTPKAPNTAKLISAYVRNVKRGSVLGEVILKVTK